MGGELVLCGPSKTSKAVLTSDKCNLHCNVKYNIYPEQERCVPSGIRHFEPPHSNVRHPKELEILKLN